MNKNIIYVIIAVVIGVLAVGGYFVFRNNGNNTNNSQKQTTTPTAAETTNSVRIKDFAFSPSEIKVKKGTTVTWKNEDSATHKIKSDAFESGDLATGDTYQFKFESTGTFSYICSIHPSMKGTVTVE
ncbi:MAG: cupredoxin family copper-binding protein [bacterium]